MSHFTAHAKHFIHKLLDNYSLGTEPNILITQIK